MTLGMIWTIILRFAIQDISVEGEIAESKETKSSSFYIVTLCPLNVDIELLQKVRDNML